MTDTAPLDRDAVARVLRRATEMSDGADVQAWPELTGVSEQALVAAADEVGIPAAAVRRAIAVERLGPDPRRHAGDRVLGPGVVVVHEELRASAAEVLDLIDDWLVAGHHLRRDRLRDGRGEWTKRSGLVGAAVRSIRTATGEGQLGHVRRVAATVRDTGEGTCVVRIEADRREDRAAHAAAGVVVGGAATAGVVAAALVAGPLLLLAAPVTLAAGAGVASTGRGRSGRVTRELTRVLDAVDRHAKPVRLRVDVVKRVAGRAPR